MHMYLLASSTKIDGAPNLTITEDTEITVVCSKQKFTITIKGDEEFFRLKNGEKFIKTYHLQAQNNNFIYAKR